MPTGLRIPVGVNQSGGANVEADEVLNLKKNLILALQEGGDANPFQQIGLSSALTFNPQDAGTRSRAVAAIEAVISRYDDRISLIPSKPIEIIKERGTGVVKARIEYLDSFATLPQTAEVTIVAGMR